ncbi:MAG: DNA gyrase inhibitor YacG [Pseudomonadota bacterium]
MAGFQAGFVANSSTLSAACPICRAPTLERYRPFCSKRCADIDLGRWVSGSYTLQTDEEPDRHEE